MFVLRMDALISLIQQLAGWLAGMWTLEFRTVDIPSQCISQRVSLSLHKKL